MNKATIQQNGKRIYEAMPRAERCKFSDLRTSTIWTARQFCVIHKVAPLGEMIRINIPQSELREMASMPSEKWGSLLDERIEELIKAV